MTTRNLKMTMISFTALLAIAACGEEKVRPVLPVLPEAASRDEFQAKFTDACIAGAKQVKIPRVDEEELTADQLQTGCGCSLEKMNRELDDSEWSDILSAASSRTEPPADISNTLRNDVFAACFEYAVGPE